MGLADESLDFLRGDFFGGFVELTAEPTHYRGDVGGLAAFDQGDHSGCTATTLLGFYRAFMSSSFDGFGKPSV